MNFLKNILNVLYPTRCPYCGKVIEISKECCKSCSSDIDIKEIYRCLELPDKKEKLVCCSPFVYSGIVRKAIIKFKFSSKTSFATAFANSALRAFDKAYSETQFDFISCVPLSKRSKKIRGFNQSELIARRLANLLDIPFKETLIKFKHNRPQHTLTLPERKTNIEGIYKLKNEKLVKGKNILLLDDIITTGYTLIEASRVLYDGGANQVKCLALADAKKINGV